MAGLMLGHMVLRQVLSPQQRDLGSLAAAVCEGVRGGIDV